MTVISGLATLWSLAVEEHFYLIWPAVFLLIAKGIIGLRSVMVMLLVILAWRCFRYFVLGFPFQEIYIATDTRFDSILYGCLLALIHANAKAEEWFPPLRLGMAVIAAALALMVATLVLRDDTFRSTLRYSLQGIALIPLFHYAVRYPETLLFRPLNWRFVRKLGVWSYTIYLIHYVVILGFHYNGIATMGSFAMIVGAGAISILFAAAVYRFVEVPLHPLRRRFAGH